MTIRKPRQKPPRNAFVPLALALKGGAHRNSRDKRRGQKERAYERAAQEAGR